MPHVHTTTGWSRGDLLTHHGLRVTSATMTIIGLAGSGCAARFVESAIDSAVRKRLTSIPTLTARMTALATPGRRGVALLQVVLEVSGRLGHTSDRDRQRDARRRNALQEQGWKVIEFTTADLLDDPEYVLTTLASVGFVIRSLRAT